MRNRIAFVAIVAIACLGAMATIAAANPPERSATFQFTHTETNFFAEGGQSCAFPVFGSWDVTLNFVTYFDAGGNPVRVVTRIGFVGALSNPATGKSVPDSSRPRDKVTDFFAPDGTFLKEVIIDVRDDPYLHAALHFGVDANGNILFDNGRDWFVTASHVIDIQPLCAALS